MCINDEGQRSLQPNPHIKNPSMQSTQQPANEANASHSYGDGRDDLTKPNLAGASEATRVIKTGKDVKPSKADLYVYSRQWSCVRRPNAGQQT